MRNKKPQKSKTHSLPKQRMRFFITVRGTLRRHRPFDRFLHGEDLRPQRFRAEADLDHVADLHIGGGLGDAPADGHMPAVARLLCHGAALDEPRDLPATCRAAYQKYFFRPSPAPEGSAVMVMVKLMFSRSPNAESVSRNFSSASLERSSRILLRSSMKKWVMS